MGKNLKSFLTALLLLPLIVLSQAGQWEMDFDEDFAAASVRSAWSPLELAPVAWWTGNATTNDSSGNALHGTWSGAASYTNGINGQAFRFTGSSAIIKAFDARLATTNTTLCLWARVEGGAGTMRTALAMRQTTPNMGYYLPAFSDNKYSVRPATAFATIGTGVDATLNSWAHLAASYDGTDWRWFVNGQQSGDARTVAYPPATTSSLMIGALTDSGPRLYFIGAIDDVMVFDRALTANEIARIYEWRE